MRREVRLRIPTVMTLYSYGYKNVWELDEIVDPKSSPIRFALGNPKRYGKEGGKEVGGISRP